MRVGFTVVLRLVVEGSIGFSLGLIAVSVEVRGLLAFAAELEGILAVITVVGGTVVISVVVEGALVISVVVGGTVVISVVVEGALVISVVVEGALVISVEEGVGEVLRTLQKVPGYSNLAQIFNTVYTVRFVKPLHEYACSLPFFRANEQTYLGVCHPSPRT